MVAGSPRAVTRLTAIIVAVLLPVFFSSIDTARAEEERPYSLAFKLGYHLYPDSSYFSATQSIGAGGRQDFRGLSLQLFDYTYQWPTRWSLNVSLVNGYYQKFIPTQTSQHSVFVHTMTVTPLYRLAGSDAVGKWQFYGGAGVGRYGMTSRFDFASGSTAEFDTYTLGYQAIIGAEFRYSEQTGFLIENNFSRARIRFAKNEFDGLEIDVGGNTILLGVRIHF